MSGERGRWGTKRFSRGWNAQISPSLPFTISIIRDTLPFHAEFMDQRKTPFTLYFIRLYVIKHVLVSETSLFATPFSGAASFSMFLAREGHVPVCPLLFGGLNRLHSWKSGNSPLDKIDPIFKKVILFPKSHHLPPRFYPYGYFSSSHSMRPSIGSTIPLPIWHRFAKLEPECAQNQWKNDICVFSFFLLGRWLFICPQYY